VRAHNFTVNTNSPFTVLFDVAYVDEIEQDQSIIWHIFDDDVKLKGKWMEVNITIPVEKAGEDVGKPFLMKIFATR
jgi:hypothetical protein